jgi:uncharacterized cupin superfamily protein
MSRREKRALGDVFGLQAFGVNFTRLSPGGLSALHHRHSRQEEFVYVLEGEPTLVTDAGDVALRPGMCAGFRPGGDALLSGAASGDARQLRRFPRSRSSARNRFTKSR